MILFLYYEAGWLLGFPAFFNLIFFKILAYFTLLLFLKQKETFQKFLSFSNKSISTLHYFKFFNHLKTTSRFYIH